VSRATREPLAVTAGDSVAWERALSDYPASAGWVVTYALRGPGTPINLTATAAGDVHVIDLAASATASWVAGRYLVAGFATKTTERATFYEGALDVAPNPATLAAGYDARSHARRALEAIEAVLERRAAADQLAYTINGRSLQRTPFAELIVIRDRYRRDVASEDAAQRLAQGLGNPRRTIRTRFGPGY